MDPNAFDMRQLIPLLRKGVDRIGNITMTQLVVSFITPWSTGLQVVACIVTSMAIAGNAWVVSKGILTPSVRKSPFHLLLLNHSLSNFCLGTMCYPYFTYKMTHLDIEPTDAFLDGCRFWAFITFTACIVDLASSAFIAINRAMACYPHTTISRVIRSMKTTLIVLASLWIVCLLTFLTVYLANPWGFNKAAGCLPSGDLILSNLISKGDAIKLLVVWLLCSSFIAAFACCLVSYGVIFAHLRKKKSTTKASVTRKKEKVRAFVTISVTFAVFCVCWMPTVLSLVVDPNITNENPVLATMPIFESGLNPILYMVTMPVFRPKFCLRKNEVKPEVMDDTQTVNTVVSVNTNTAEISEN